MESTKKYNSENENHPSQEDLTEIDNPFKKQKVKLRVSVPITMDRKSRRLLKLKKQILR